MITASGSDNSSVAHAAVMPKLPVMADTKGRLRVSKAQRRDILEALARSGDSLPQFARRTGLKYSTLANWVQKSRRAKRSGRPPGLRLMEAVVASTATGAGGIPLVLQWPGGAKAEISDVQQVGWAAELLRALAKPC